MKYLLIKSLQDKLGEEAEFDEGEDPESRCMRHKMKIKSKRHGSRSHVEGTARRFDSLQRVEALRVKSKVLAVRCFACNHFS
jgi:hypothetical protein